MTFSLVSENFILYIFMASAVNHIVNALQFGKCSIGVYFDFSKAFDTLDHEFFLKTKSLWY